MSVLISKWLVKAQTALPRAGGQSITSRRPIMASTTRQTGTAVALGEAPAIKIADIYAPKGPRNAGHLHAAQAAGSFFVLNCSTLTLSAFVFHHHKM